MTTVAINQALILGLAALFAPLSLLWAYALYDSLRSALLGGGARGAAGADEETDFLSWPALLLLTGCRYREILTLQWQDVKGNRLLLRDSKTGPGIIYGQMICQP